MSASWFIAMAAWLSLLGAGYVWVTRTVVREELRPVLRKMNAHGEEIAVLRSAVFNHLSHGERADENEIRERLRLAPRE